ncbi:MULTISPECIES: universal stress protein [Vitreoscilla]|uniref:Universal stress protein n=1 Tax=Vitreoscilla stercoraria TaxID=61 RepID=A0ABY4EBU9_VITST|nr:MULTISPECIES: universal stress protein [Vitreoscilla]AUZ05923.1 universal stress protein [Vitreoscilla sp. C1]UOO92704.1 universal stress protein [Vitreoscilla stercoraria]
MYKNLVVAIDGSNTSLKALRHAAQIAIAGQGKITLVNIANPTEYMALAPEFLQEDGYEATALAQAERVLDDAQELAKSLGLSEVQRHIAISIKGVRDMAQLLVDYSVDSGADLLVLGTHGRTGLMHLLMGSFAETVMRQTDLPLLVIRGSDEDVATDDE